MKHIFPKFFFYKILQNFLLCKKYNHYQNWIIYLDLLSKISYYPIYIQFEIAFLPRLFLGLK